jgi:hypothetical protein
MSSMTPAKQLRQAVTNFGMAARQLITDSGGCLICRGRTRSCLGCHGRAWRRLYR